jgi:RNA polymerase sigma-70 factor (ECF subfamily)
MMEDFQATSQSIAENDSSLIQALRNGDENAFLLLVDKYQPSMLRFAMIYVLDRAVAEEAVQEAWLAVLEGLSRFEGRSSLKTWIYRILRNCAVTRAQRESRSIAFSSFMETTQEATEPAVDVECFFPPGHPNAGQWKYAPRHWPENPEDYLLSQEMRSYIEKAIAALPANQQEVITLRDIEGWTAQDVCTSLGITDANQRVLLHRARSRVRNVLERYFDQKDQEV